MTGLAKVTAEGLDVAQAAWPKGPRRLLLEIKDSMGRTDERLLQFVVD